jgi:hypothetical protein
MDAERFDGLVRVLGSGTNRRLVLAGLTLGALAGRAGWRGADAAECAKAGQKPKADKPCCAQLRLVDGRCATCPDGRVLLSNGTCAVPCPNGGADCGAAGCAGNRCVGTNEGNVCGRGCPTGDCGDCAGSNADCPTGSACVAVDCELVC